MERAPKRLVNEVKVSGLILCLSIYIYHDLFTVVRLIPAGHNENGEVPKKVLRPN